mmetsp:Transcript_16259/g.24599  ORF Transcript_16259/g.24599 Transcript_16259/m.24599 type:complete len:304 (+) Transcript_16259:43-954(+)
MKLYRVALLLSLLSNEASAFSTISTRQQSLTHHVTSSNCYRPSSLLMAGTKRRRRKDSSIVAPSPSDELPDFEDAEDDDFIADELPLEASTTSATPAAASTVVTTKRPTQLKKGSGLNSQLAEELGGNVDGLAEDLILESMRGKAGGDKWQPPQSIKDTLADRSLEKLMNFDKMIEQDGGAPDARIDLPEFDDVIARRKARLGEEDGAQQFTAASTSTEINSSGMGKKAARDAQRKAAAVQREAEIEAEKSPFEGVNILKLLENGAWVGIGLLVLWEFYINSPFFDRALPLIPVVYDDFPPGM